MKKGSAVWAAVVFAMSVVFAATANPKRKGEPLPVATYDSVAYGTHPRQVVDVWLPASADKPSPVVVFIHGGGFTKGDRKDPRLAKRIAKCRKQGVALIAVEYRFIKHAGDVKPPVKVCFDDVLSAIRFIRQKAGDWNLDVKRMGLTGGSAGGCASIFAGLTGDNEFGIKVVYAQYSQTTIDPKEMREWIPNSKYGANLFGYPDFQTWLDHREEVLPWIEKFSGTALLRRCTPSKAPEFLYDGLKAPPPGELAKDPTHSGTFNVKFRELAEKRGVVFRYGSFDKMLALLNGGRNIAK